MLENLTFFSKMKGTGKFKFSSTVPFKFLLVPGILSFFYFCGPGEAEYFEPLSYLKYHLQFETGTPLILRKAPRYFFYRGFRTRSEPVEVIRTNAEIRFFSYTAQQIGISCQLVKGDKQAQDLKLKLYLNGTVIKEFILPSKRYLEIVLPASLIKRGTNLLKFQVEHYRYRINPDTLAYPEVIFYLKEFKFQQKPEVSTLLTAADNHLNQPANSYFHLALDGRRESKLHFVIRSSGSKGQGCLKIRQIYPPETEREIKRIFLLPNRRMSVDIPLKGKRETILQFDYAHPEWRSSLGWEKIGIIKSGKRPAGEGDRVRRVPMALKGKPHIFLLMIDAARDDILDAGPPAFRLIPNIRQFAGQATRFAHFYANAPYTSASVASMLTGLHPEAHTDREALTILSRKIKSLPAYLKDLGYHTHLVTGNVILLKHRYQRHFEQSTLIRPPVGKDELQRTSYNDLARARQIIISLDPRQPQFIYFHFLPPHAPYQVPDKIKGLLPQRRNAIPSFLKGTKDENYSRLVSRDFNSYLDNYFYADYLIGGILDALKEKGLFDQSLIILCADHGEAFGEHEHFGHLYTVYQEMIRIPFLLKLPFQKQPALEKNSHSLVDLLPTLAHLLRIPSAPHWQGRSFFSAPGSADLIYSRAVKKDINCTLIEYPYKFIFYSGREELYHLGEDPGEAINLIHEYPYKSLRMKQKLFEILFKNQRLRIKLGLKRQLNKISSDKFLNELKTLGYLE